MKEKYIHEKYGIFYDGAGTIFYRLNTREERSIELGNLPKEVCNIIVEEHEKLLEEIVRLMLNTSNDGMNFPKNQCTNCGAWVGDDYKEKHEAHCLAKVISSNNNLEKKANI